MAKRVLYFIGTQYQGKPIFSVRGNTYQPTAIGDALQVDEKDVADLVSKAQIYYMGRTYQGFTADPHVAAAIKKQVESGKRVMGVPVDATLMEQLNIAGERGTSANTLDEISLEDLEALLSQRKKAAPAAAANNKAKTKAEEKSEE